MFGWYCYYVKQSKGHTAICERDFSVFPVEGFYPMFCKDYSIIDFTPEDLFLKGDVDALRLYEQGKYLMTEKQYLDTKKQVEERLPKYIDTHYEAIVKMIEREAKANQWWWTCMEFAASINYVFSQIGGAISKVYGRWDKFIDKF